MSKQYPVRGMGPNLKKVLLATVSAAVAGASASAAFAQEAATAEVDEIVVTGFRKSLSDARAIKQDSVIQVDAIVAEDMAKFRSAVEKVYKA